MKPTISIVGGGMNAVTLALALRLFGFKATIFEANSEIRAEGTGIYLWPEGLQVLAALTGEPQEVAQLGQQVNFFNTRRFDDAPIQRQPLAPDEINLLAHTTMFHRTPLFEYLVNKLGRDTFVLNKKTERIEQDENQATIYFQDGTSHSSDIVIGADGLFSTVRETIDSNLNPIYSGISTCRGIVNFDSPLFADDECYIYSGKHSRIVTYTTDAKTHQRYWFSAYQHDDNNPLPSHDELLKIFGYYHPDLCEMLARTPHENLIPSKLYDLNPATTWVNGRIAILGDAAHAVLPTMACGFSLGIENAFILAQGLASNHFDVQKSLKRYEMRALPRANKLIELTREFTRLFYLEEPGSVTPEVLAPLYEEFFEVAHQSPF